MTRASEERRRTRRTRRAEEAGPSVRFLAGGDATVLDHSDRGLLVASTTRLLPGRRCFVTWPGHPPRAAVVVRSLVGRLNANGSVVYHVAIEFEDIATEARERTTHHG
jgi:hypothetical protein